MSQNQEKKFKNYYIYLGKGYDPAHDSDQIAVENNKMQRRGWEILVIYFAQKSQFFVCYFPDQESFLKELKLIKPFLGEFKLAPEFGPSDETPDFFNPELIMEALKKTFIFEPNEDAGSGEWLKAECQITPEFVEAIINTPLPTNIIGGPPSPFFDFKFYQNDQQRFNSSDYGADVAFDATADEAKEVEALLNQAGVKFGYLRIS